MAIWVVGLRVGLPLFTITGAAAGTPLIDLIGDVLHTGAALRCGICRRYWHDDRCCRSPSINPSSDARQQKISADSERRMTLNGRVGVTA